VGRRAGPSWLARYPWRDDREPSRWMRQSQDGNVLVRCHAGCEQARVIAALRSRWLWQDGHPRRFDRLSNKAPTAKGIERSQAAHPAGVSEIIPLRGNGVAESQAKAHGALATSNTTSPGAANGSATIFGPDLTTPRVPPGRERLQHRAGIFAIPA
jgi:hypothetical protein